MQHVWCYEGHHARLREIMSCKSTQQVSEKKTLWFEQEYLPVLRNFYRAINYVDNFSLKNL